jgi:signal transduction histidine kinase
MNGNPAKAEPKSPERSLGYLYFASHTTIAVLLALGEVYLLRDLAWRRLAIRSITEAARQEVFDRSLGQTVLSILATKDPAVRRDHVESLRAAPGRDRAGVPGASHLRAEAGGPLGASGRLFLDAAPHRSAAITAAATVLGKLEPGDPGTAGFAETNTLVQTLVTEETAHRRALGDAILQLEREAAAHSDHLESTEFMLFVLVMIVLLMLGIYVIGPAMRKIRAYMDDAERSHDEMKRYAARLERSNKELQDFASVASHDLQEPLRKIQAFSDRLRSKYRRELDDQGRDYLDRIQNSGKRMQTLISDLLTFSRVTTKAQPFVPTDLNEATRDVLCDLEVRIEQVRGRVELAELPTLDADPLQMRQLMQNLIGNALKYHRPDAPPVVKVSSRRSSGHASERCEILVEDNGIGFEQIYADRIFTIFQRLHGRTEYEGTGVGLAVCRKIAERHGGSITARSTPGEGSTFTVTLPVRHQKEAVADAAPT